MIALESRIPCARNPATLLRQPGLSQALDQPDTILLPGEGALSLCQDWNPSSVKYPQAIDRSG
jgi:hypothetical protein